MIIAGAVFGCQRDEAFLPHFLRAWRRAHDTDVVLLNDTRDPIIETCGLDCYPSSWSSSINQAQNVLESLGGVISDRGLDAVIKLDIDCIHRRICGKSWLDNYTLDMAMYGHQHDRFSECVYGAAYVIRADVVHRLALTGGACSRFEDVAISRSVSKSYPDDYEQIKIRDRVFAGYSSKSSRGRLESFEVLHIGQGLDRVDAPDVMRSLAG